MRQGGAQTSAAKGKRGSTAIGSLVNAEEIERLVRLMEANGLVEIEVHNGRGKIKLVRENHRTTEVRGKPSGAPDAAGAAAGRGGGAVAVTAPMVGTFHRALEPGGEPLAKVGDVVSRGEVLGVIEAMKMMNEIEAELSGRIEQVLVEDGKPVEYGQPLFLIEPLPE